MPSNRQPSVVFPGPGKLAAGQVPASALAFPVGEAELGGKELAINARTSLATAGGGGVSSIVLPAGTFVGDSTGYPLDFLFDIVDDQERAILNAGIRVVVASITGAAVGSLFTPSTVTLNLSPSIPAGIQYQTYYQRRSTLASLPIDALTFDRGNVGSGSSAAGISYGASGNWADGSQVTATNVEGALDEIVSDLANTTDGAAKIGTTVSSTWADASTVSATAVQAALNEIVSDLANTTNGGSKIGTTVSSTWANGNTVASTNVQGALNEIVSDLADTAAGAARVGTTVSGTWADATAVSATTVQAALVEIVSDLANTTDGAAKIGTTVSSVWADASTVSATAVQAALDEIVSDLANTTGGAKVGNTIGAIWATAGGNITTAATVADGFNSLVDDLAQVGIATTSGASRIAVFPTNFSGALSVTGGGGLTTSTAQIQDALQQANNQLVARRAFTEVITDGTNSIGGDRNGTSINTPLSAANGGTYLLRRGSYTSTVSPTIGHQHALIGERYSSSNAVLVRYTGGAASSTIQWTPKGTANDDLGNLYENLHFAVTSLSTRRWSFADGRHEIRNCRAGVGTVRILPGSYYAEVDINGLLMSTDSDSSGNTESLLFTTNIQPLPVYGRVSNLTISAVPSSSASAKAGLSLKDMPSVTSYQSLVFESCAIAPTTGWAAANGSALEMNAASSPVMFRGCKFEGNSSGLGTSIVVASFTNAGNVVFENCVFIQNSGGALLSFNTCVGEPIVFRKCKFVSNGAGTMLSAVSSENVVFEDCVFDSQSSAKLMDVDSTNTAFSFVRTTFLSSLTTVNNAEMVVQCSDYERPHSFTRCRIDLRSNSNTSTVRLAFGATAGNLTAGESGPVINGLDVRLTDVGTSINRRTFIYRTTNATRAPLVSDLRFHLAGKQVVGSGGTGIIEFNASESQSVRDLYLYDLCSPITTGGGYAVLLVGTAIQGGVVLPTPSPVPANDVEFDGVFGLGTQSSVVGVVFNKKAAPVTNSVRGRYFDMFGAGGRVQNNRIYGGIHSLESSSGYFARVSTTTNYINGNHVEMASSLGAGALSSSTPWIEVASNSGILRVTDNFFTTTGINLAIPFITGAATSGEIIVSDNHVRFKSNTVNTTPVNLAGDRCTVTDNIFFDQDASTQTITVSGASPVNIHNTIT